jgi:Tol biopolymer transport system component
MGRRGEDARKLIDGGDFNTFRSVQWSPRGQRLIYSRDHAGGKAFIEFSIESCDLQGRAVVIVPRLAGHAGLCWVPDGRVLYSVDLRGPDNENTNIWEIRVDPTTGRPVGPKQRITNWTGIHTDRFSVSEDGKRLLVQKTYGVNHVFVGRLEPSGTLEDVRRLTLEDSHDAPLAWTPDGKAILFASDRTGTWKPYRQALDQAQAEPLTTGPEDESFFRLSPDSRWILFRSRARDGSPFARYMRLPLSGGPAEFVIQTGRSALIGCPVSPATDCVLTEWTPDRKETILTAFNPLSGQRRALFKFQLPPEAGSCCGLSPNAREFAVLLNDAHESRIRLLSYSGEFERDIPLKGWTHLNSADWAVDSQSIFVSSGTPTGATLLRVYLSGRVDRVWTTTNGAGATGSRTWGIQSPDLRHLAVLGHSTSSNAWLLENF